MKNIFKKNQIMITALAIMILVAGYLSFSGTKLGDSSSKAKQAANQKVDKEKDAEKKDGKTKESGEKEAQKEIKETGDKTSSNLTNGDLLGDISSLDEDFTEDGQVADNSKEDSQSVGEAVLANSQGGNLFSSTAKVAREQVRAKNKETLLEVINNANVSDEQKKNAVDSMVALTEIAEKEGAAEILLEAKGFLDVVVNMNDSGVDVVVNMTELSDSARAQIEDIVKRKTQVAADKIVITPVTAQE